MKTILLPFYDDDASQHAFTLASRLARKSKAYLEGLFVMRRPQLFDSDSEVVTDSYFTQLAEECRRVADAAHSRFDTCVAANGLTIGSLATCELPCAGW